VTGVGTVVQSIVRQNVGVILQVTPRISPDGTVLMRVVPEVSSVAPNSAATGNGSQGATLNVQHLETTVLARDGETVAIGGMIQKTDSKNENKVPVLSDIPYLGTLFRYRTQYKTKTELFIIMTPHIIRSPADAHRVFAEEAHRMDWILGDVTKIHGDIGLNPPFPVPPAMPFGTSPGPAIESAPPPRVLPPAIPGSPSGSASPPAPPVPATQPGPQLSPTRDTPPAAAAPVAASNGKPLPAGPGPTVSDSGGKH
jgi:hypothetical protein